VKAFSRGEHETARFHETHQRYNDARLESVGTWGRWMPAIHLARNSGLVLVLAGGTWLLARGASSGMTLGVLVAFVMYVQFFYQPFGELFGLYDRVLKAGAAMERVREVLSAPVDVADPPDAVPLPPLRGDVRFERVSFRYRTGEEVLRDLDLDVAAGETVALVGSSGAGKTSIVSLVARFHDPTAGVVRVDGIDVRTVRQSDLRSQIGVVTQETFLFNDTVRENLLYGSPAASPTEIEEAVRVARADGFIARLPQGYDTVIGERGVRLSAGQKQRLSLARALLARPRILILDEPTSMLDAESERHIEAAMEDVRDGRTTLVIAHRLSTVRRADRILVVEDGRVVESGTHDHLMALGGRYRALYEMQIETVERRQPL